MEEQTNFKIVSFTDLRAWQEGHKLVLMVYKATEAFPQKEIYGLSSQMRRAAVSITSNIAEGFRRKTVKDKIHFYIISHGSLAELQNQMLIARDLGYLGSKNFKELSTQSIFASRLIGGLKKII